MQGQVYSTEVQILSHCYFQHCDKVITREYPEMKGKSQVSSQMTGEEVKVNCNDPTVKFDKSPMQVSIITIRY